MHSKINNEGDWEEFEKAVAAFISALDPTAAVQHNVRLPDRHHGGPRQRDVWIETKLAGHFPVSALVSCKRYKRRLHSGDLDAFHGELIGSDATLGILYSFSGFSKPAIAKGRALGIPCCCLYQGRAPEIPSHISFTTYSCAPQMQLSVSGLDESETATWQDLFDVTVRSDAGITSILDELVARYYSAERAAVQAIRSTVRLPQPFQTALEIQPKTGGSPITVVATGRWKFYRAKLEAYEVNGSYEFTSGDFKGSVATPWIDRLDTNLGPGWEPIEEPPKLVPTTLIAVLYRGNAKEALLAQMAPKPLVHAAAGI